MMKKIILFSIIFIFSISSLIAETIKYKVVADTFYSDGDIEFTIPIKKDTTVTWESNTSVLPNINDDDIYENFLMDIEYNNEIIYMLSTDLQVIDTEKIVDNKKLLRLIPEYYLEVLCKKNTDLIFEKQPLWNERKKRMENEPFPFEESFQPESYYISNTVILFSQHNYYLVKNVKKKNNNIELDLLHYSDDDVTEYFGKTEDVFSEVYNKFRSNSNIKLLIQTDGDYFYLWINTKENYIGKYIAASESLCEQIVNLVRSNKCDLSKVTWPRHADGSCDYDGSKKTASVQTAKATSSTNVSPNKTMIVSENLKLRSAEATTSDVLTVMSAGTKVKILELGKAENIDGISSNWVKVEVQSGVKDRDGNTISRGTVGWCYGGYLAETTEANNFESIDTKEISDIKIEEAPKQEINIGIVCAIVGAVLLLLLLILIFAVRKKKDNP